MRPEILLAEPRGFCAGVERALEKVEEALRNGPFPVYVLHEIVHNETVVENLRRRGVIFINDPAEAKGGTLVFSAHGVSRAVEEQTAKLPVKAVDATCPIVKSLHRRIESFAAKRKNIIMIAIHCFFCCAIVFDSIFQRNNAIPVIIYFK